jgi:hypothetical protein
MPGQETIQLIRKCLPIARIERVRTAGFDAGFAQTVHEIPHTEVIPDVVPGIQFAARIQRLSPGCYRLRSQGDIRGDDQVPGCKHPQDGIVRHVKTGFDPH